MTTWSASALLRELMAFMRAAFIAGRALPTARGVAGNYCRARLLDEIDVENICMSDDDETRQNKRRTLRLPAAAGTRFPGFRRR